jgi:transcriptional regulator
VYTPAHFRIDDLATMHDVIRDNSFGVLVCAGHDGMPTGTHLPFILEPETGANGTLRAHMARANGQWKAFDGTTEALVIFQGVHGYISPRWYDREDMVPTWDYVTVHCAGRPRILDLPAPDMVSYLAALVAQYERHNAEPWSLSGPDRAWLERLTAGIVVFEMPIARIEGKAKLGQNHPAQQQRVAAALEGLGDHNLAMAVMRANGLA